ncbi:MAG: hypothetical protein WCI77_04260 [Candidatus Omnitrophota bacterium]
MREKIFETKMLYWLSSIVILAIAVCACFLYTNTASMFLFEKAVNHKKTALDYAENDYYTTVLSFLTKAIAYHNGNAEYIVLKADTMLQASGEGLANALVIKDDEIEGLYRQAIDLNPINWEYHLKLGYYYAQKENPHAEGELLRAAQLSWKNYKPHRYLAQYYIQKQDYKKAFNHMILFLAYANQWERVRDYFKLLSDTIPIKAEVHSKWGDMSIHFVAYPGASDFKLHAYGFPYEKVPFKIIAYLNKPLTTVKLYRNNSFYADFRWIGEKENMNMYQLELGISSADPYLDELLIKTGPQSLIEKIVFIRDYKIIHPGP